MLKWIKTGVVCLAFNKRVEATHAMECCRKISPTLLFVPPILSSQIDKKVINFNPWISDQKVKEGCRSLGSPCPDLRAVRSPMKTEPESDGLSFRASDQTAWCRPSYLDYCASGVENFNPKRKGYTDPAFLIHKHFHLFNSYGKVLQYKSRHQMLGRLATVGNANIDSNFQLDATADCHFGRKYLIPKLQRDLSRYPRLTEDYQGRSRSQKVKQIWKERDIDAGKRERGRVEGNLSMSWWPTWYPIASIRRAASSGLVA